ncbi:1422_t:CDS:2 [Ambispora gerdemannii]|uniref:1422_t:CDS:1 n=1 Tax=Ambispora gerdemannii TaxID=144530 RepID=A0A9N9C9X5_9GLOM|nr:1422_t:CDS:2 [Ambispora gerdemannii]
MSASLDTLQFQTVNTTSSSIPGIAFGTTVLRNTEIYLFGGLSKNTSNVINGNTYKFDSISKRWAPVDFVGIFADRPSSKRSLSSVIDNTGNWYLFGGSNETNLTIGNNEIQNDPSMYIFNLISMKGSKQKFGSVDNNVDSFLLPMIEYTATFLDDNKIVYIGGKTSRGELVDMSSIYVFDTVNQKWLRNQASNSDVVPMRSAHSAVLATNRRQIIIYGGLSTKPLTDKNALAILDTIDFSWSIPNIEYFGQSIPASHSAVLFGDYMIVAFGILQDGQKPIQQENSTYLISILDTLNGNFTWVKTISRIPPHSNTTGVSYNNSGSSSASPSGDTNQGPTSTSSFSKTGAIIGGTAGGLVIFAIIGTLAFILHRRQLAQCDLEGSRHAHMPQHAGYMRSTTTHDNQVVDRNSRFSVSKYMGFRNSKSSTTQRDSSGSLDDQPGIHIHIKWPNWCSKDTTENGGAGSG